MIFKYYYKLSNKLEAYINFRIKKYIIFLINIKKIYMYVYILDK